MADVNEKMWTRRARDSSTLVGSVILISCCSYILFKRFKKRKKDIIVFSRYPQAGKAKTRLIPSLGQSGAAQMQICMVKLNLLNLIDCLLSFIWHYFHTRHKIRYRHLSSQKAITAARHCLKTTVLPQSLVIGIQEKTYLWNSVDYGVTTYRKGPERTYEIPKQTSMGTETDRNGLQWVPKRTGTDFSSYGDKLQWEPEKVGWGTIGTSLLKLCMYW